jgi:hypothetical protein
MGGKAIKSIRVNKWGVRCGLTEAQWWTVVNTVMNHREISRLAESLSASQEGLCSRESIKSKVKQSRYTPWRRLGGEEV